MDSVCLLLLLLLVVGGRAAAPQAGPLKQLGDRLGRQRAGARIVGGQAAFPGQLPYQALVVGEGDGVCGGALIARGWVLTAAQCLDSLEGLYVFLGVTDWQSDEPQQQPHTVRRAIAHPQYDPYTLANDIALLQLFREAVITEFVEPVWLDQTPCGSSGLEGRVAVASGFGRTSDLDPVSQQLRWAAVEVIPNGQCAAVWGPVITDSALCTLGVRGLPGGICHGDQGGPLVAGEELVAVASAVPAAGCERPRPHRFTRVACYRDWIREVAGVE